MNNVTMVIPTEREVNYHLFMYTMYNSPAPSLRQLAAFMLTDLGFKQLEVRTEHRHNGKIPSHCLCGVECLGFQGLW